MDWHKSTMRPPRRQRRQHQLLLYQSHGDGDDDDDDVASDPGLQSACHSVVSFHESGMLLFTIVTIFFPLSFSFSHLSRMVPNHESLDRWACTLGFSMSWVAIAIHDSGFVIACWPAYLC